MKASHDSNGCNCLVRGAVTGDTPAFLGNSNITPTGPNVTTSTFSTCGSVPSRSLLHSTKVARWTGDGPAAV